MLIASQLDNKFLALCKTRKFDGVELILDQMNKLPSLSMSL